MRRFDQMHVNGLTARSAGTWKLGDVTVNRLGFGAMRLTQESGDVAADRERATRVLRRAVELGVNHIDTAAFYFSPRHWANELIRSALAPYPQDLLIVTKVGPSRDRSGEWQPLPRPEQLRGQVEENLRQLGLDCLDVVLFRSLSTTASIAEHFGALAELRQAGLVRHLGLSAVKPSQLAEAQAIAPVVCVSNSYGLGYRRTTNDDFVRLCGAQGIAFTPFFAVAGAAREAGGVARDDVVADVARRHGASVAQIRIAWTLARGPHVLAIPGTGDPDHLEENVAAADLRLSDDDLRRLDAV